MSITVNAVHRRVQYTSTGSLGPYSFSFKVLASGDVRVYVDATLKTASTHYNVSLSSDGTGSVTFTSGNAPASDTVVTIESNQAIERTSDYTTGGDFKATSINDDLDRLAINDQQIETALTRTIQLPNTVARTTSGSGTSGPLEFPYSTTSDNASKLIAFTSAGNALETTTGRVSSVSASNVATSSGTPGSATASFTSSSGALALGIPVGQTGQAAGISLQYSTTTTDARPGAGFWRANNTSLNSASILYVDDSDGTNDITAQVQSWDDSTNSTKGFITIHGNPNAASPYVVFRVTSTVTDATDYTKIPVAYVAGSTSISNNAETSMSFSRAGDAGSLSDPTTTRGDILFRNSSGAIARLAIGSSGTVLQGGTDPSYAAVDLTSAVTGVLPVANGGSGASSLGDGHVLLGSGTGAVTALDVTAKGSVLVGDGSGDPRALAVGTNTHVLTADSGEASGLKWAAASGGKLTAEFISSATDITADSVHTFSHSLGARPSVVQVYIKCTSADANWASGDYLLLGGSAGGNGGSIDCGYMIQTDATNVEIILGSCIRIHNQSTFNEVSANLSNWDWVVVAYKGGTV